MSKELGYMLFKRIPFMGVHISLALLFFVGFSWPAFWVFCLSTFFRMLGITGGFHRYFSHRSYKTSRGFQLFLAILGTSAAQHGPLWWAAHHRHHHRHSDTTEDIHSPNSRSFWHAHLGWLFEKRYYKSDLSAVKDLSQYPELVWIDKNHRIVPITYGVLMWGIGWALERTMGGSVSALQVFTWGFSVSTVLIYHVTFSINSLSHLFGKTHFKTEDHSKNNWVLAILTLGEGWHNNHHRYPKSQRQGFIWWQIDITHYVICILEKAGLVWDVSKPPKSVLKEAY